MVYVVSLKSEADLFQESICKDIYSKIFDYTLAIKPIHNELLEAILIALIESKKEELQINSENTRKTIQKEYLPKLEWIIKGEHLTIRELKDRLNDTFILFEALKSRKDNANISLKKCAAVSYLQRRYPEEFNKLLLNEDIFAQTIKDTIFYQHNPIKKDEIVKIIQTSLKSSNKEFEQDIINMISEADIDIDFKMYFYNYPKDSYIKNLDEQDIFNYILYPEIYLYEKEQHDELKEKISRIINKKTDYSVITEAFTNLGDNPFPQIILAFEELYKMAYKFNSQKTIALIINTIAITNENIEKNHHFIATLLSYGDLDVDEIFSEFVKTLQATLLKDPVNLIKRRMQIINSAIGHESLFRNLYFETMPLITPEELISIKNPETALDLVNIEKIDNATFVPVFKEINKLNLSPADLSKKYGNIPALNSMQNAGDILLEFMTKYGFTNHDFLKIIINDVFEEKIPEGKLINYLIKIDLTKLTKDELEEIDAIGLINITDINVLNVLENEDFYLSSLLSRAQNNLFDSFNIDNKNHDEFIDLYIKIAPNILKIAPSLFITIRNNIIIKIHNKEDKLYNLFTGNYPLVTPKELDATKNVEDQLYWYLDFPRITIDNSNLIYDFINQNKFNGNKLYEILQNLFNNEKDTSNLIANTDIQKEILKKIDYVNIRISSMKEEQIINLCKYLNNTFSLSTTNGAIEFMNTVKTLIPELEELFFKGDNIPQQQYKEYVTLINTIKIPSNKTLELITKIPLEVDFAFETSVTELLLRKKYYPQYIISTIIKNQEFIHDENIPIQDQYNVFIKNSSCSIFMAKSKDFISKIIHQQLINNDLPDSYLKYFYNERQTTKLFTLIIHRLGKDLQKIKEYLNASFEFDTKKDSDNFRDYILTDEYIEIFRDESLYHKIYYKLWNETNKQGFTKKINKQLGVNYRKDSSYTE